MHNLQSLSGLLFFFIAWLISENRRAVPWRAIGIGIGLQFLLAGLMLHLNVFRKFFLALNDMLLALQQATQAGTSFVFGYLGGAPLPFEETQPGASFVFATRALPLVLVISALTSLLFYWRVLPWLVNFVSRLLEKTMGIGGALGIGAAANIFVGMVEAPLFVRPYLQAMSRSELFALMTTGMATIAGTMMVLYATIIGPVVPDAMGHILTASILSAPAALAMAMIMVPPADQTTAGHVVPPQLARGSMDAVTQGTLQGVTLLINIIGMLIVLVALVSLINLLLGLLPDVQGQALTLQRLLGLFMAPLVWLMGIPWHEAMTAGALMGTKTVLNEFLAYLDLAALPAEAMQPHSRLIMTYALCGFANFGSLGIMIGGMGTMAPDRRDEIVRLGFRSMIAGTLATMMTGAVVALVIPAM